MVVTAKLALVAPAATVTEAGTVAVAVLPLASVTTAPPAGAAVLSVTVPVLPAPPVTVPGLKVSEASGGFTTRVDVLVVPLYVAVMVAVVGEVTADVEMLNVACVCPVGTRTDVGTEAAALLLLSATVTPPKPGAKDIVTVPIALIPATIAVGETLNEASAVALCAESFTTNPSFPPALCDCRALATGKFPDPV